MNKKIPMVIILNVDYDKAVDGGTRTVGEYLENTMENLRGEGIELVDYITAYKNSSYEWERYLGYLCKWIIDHSNDEYEGMSPCCFDEWKDNEDNN